MIDNTEIDRKGYKKQKSDFLSFPFSPCLLLVCLVQRVLKYAMTGSYFQRLASPLCVFGSCPSVLLSFHFYASPFPTVYSLCMTALILPFIGHHCRLRLSLPVILMYSCNVKSWPELNDDNYGSIKIYYVRKGRELFKIPKIEFAKAKYSNKFYFERLQKIFLRDFLSGIWYLWRNFVSWLIFAAVAGFC